MEQTPLDKARDAYLKLFGDTFPSSEVHPENDQHFLELIQKCIAANKPAKEVFNLDYTDTDY